MPKERLLTPQDAGGHVLPLSPLPPTSAMFHTFRPQASIPYRRPMGSNLRRVHDWRTTPSRPPANALLAILRPGDAAASVPALGIASNMDQLLNMGLIEAAGAGLMLHADPTRGPPVGAHELA